MNREILMKKFWHWIVIAAVWVFDRVSYVFLVMIHSLEWSQLKSIQQHNLVKSSYIWLFIVPVISKAFQYLETPVKINVFEHLFELDLVLPFAWQVFFLCALLFVLANVIFILFCPPLIKENNHYGDFQAAGKDEKYLNKYKASFNSLSEKTKNRLMHLAGIEKKEIEGDALRSQFWRVYLPVNHSLIPVRLICSFCYFVALLLFSDVMYDSIKWVYGQTSVSSFSGELYFGPVVEWAWERL